MLYQLPNGNTIEISTEKYLELSDDDLNYLMATGQGENLDNPWHGSILDRQSVEDLTDEEFDDLIEEKIRDVNDLDTFEKIDDIDIDPTMFDD